MAAGAVRVKGLREFQRACNKADKQTKTGLRARLRDAGDTVRGEASARFAHVDGKSAAGYRVAVRARGVAVEQRLGRTTGRRPDFGAKQMREALVPALEAKRGQVERNLEDMLDDIIDGF